MKRLLPFFSLILLAGCSSNSTILQLEFDDVSGLETGSPLLQSGLKIGEIKKFSVLPSSHILTAIELKPGIALHQNDTFMLSSLDLIGSKGIIVKESHSAIALDLAQIQKGTRETPVIDTSFINKAGKLFSKQATEAQIDSLEKEVKKLNKTLEEMKKTK